MSHDVHIRGGLVVDGTGGPARRADVAIDGGRVVEVAERLEDGAARTIEADGRIVCPGFVDLHTHYDIQAFWDPSLSPSPLHGVTTAIAGNCGFSVAPMAGSEADVPHADAGPGGGDAARLAGCGHRLELDLVRLVPGPPRRHGGAEPGLPGRPLGHPPRDHGSGRQRAGRLGPTRSWPCAGCWPRAWRPGPWASRPRGLRRTSTATAARCPRGGPTRSSCWSCAGRSGAIRARRSSSSPGWATSPRREGDLMGRMSAAADRPLNWNVLVVIAGMADKVAAQLGRVGPAAEPGGPRAGADHPHVGATPPELRLGLPARHHPGLAEAR